MRGELAQWLEQRNHNPLVPSSNLGFATKESKAYVQMRKPFVFHGTLLGQLWLTIRPSSTSSLLARKVHQACATVRMFYAL